VLQTSGADIAIFDDVDAFWRNYQVMNICAFPGYLLKKHDDHPPCLALIGNSTSVIFIIETSW